MNTRRQCLHFHTHSGRGTRGRTRGGDRSARVFAGASPCVGPRARGGGRRDVGRGEQLPRGSGGAVTGSCGRAGCQLPRSRVPVRCEQRQQREMSSGKADFPLQAAGLEVLARGSQPGCSREFTSSQFTERRPGSECRTARTDGSPADGGRCPAGAPRSGLRTRRLPGRGGRGVMRDLHHPAAPPPPPRRLEISGHRRVGQGSEMSQPSHPSLLPAVAEHRHVFTPPSTHSAPSITHPPLFAMLRPGSLLLRAQPPPRCRPSSSLELRLPLGSRSAPVSFAALF